MNSVDTFTLGAAVLIFAVISAIVKIKILTLLFLIVGVILILIAINKEE